MLGSSLLAMCALVAGLGSVVTEFSHSHVYSERWPARARRSSACFGLLNAALALMSLGLLVAGVPGLAGSLLLLMDIVMLSAALVPGVDIVAEGERVIARLPVSYWLTFPHLVLVVLGMGLCGGVS